MKKQNKKGFTIVELVIVIAVIAILAAVLIPTFSNIIKKAQASADVQACREMNEYLAINEITEDKTIYDVYEALAEGGMDAKDYKPLTSDTFYFWDSTLNRVLYTDNEYNVTYPEEYSSVKKTDHQWYSLSGEINSTQPTGYTETSTSVNVSSAEELYYVAHSSNKVLTTVTLSSGTIDVMGADVGFTANSSVKLTGSGEGTVIKGLCQAEPDEISSTRSGNEGKNYGSGLITAIKGSNVTLENITIQDSVIGDLETGSVGAFVGVVGAGASGGSVTLVNCHVINCEIYGKNKVGGLIGAVWGGSGVSVTITNCSVDGCTINCSEGEAGKVIGTIYGSPDLITLDRAPSAMIDTDNNIATKTTLNLVDCASGNNELHRTLIEKELTFEYKNGESIKTATLTGLGEKLSVSNGDGVSTNIYRPFNSNASITFQCNNSGKYKVVINGTSTTYNLTATKFMSISDYKTDENLDVSYEDLIK